MSLFISDFALDLVPSAESEQYLLGDGATRKKEQTTWTPAGSVKLQLKDSTHFGSIDYTQAAEFRYQ
jgi:hypothetical protein